MPEPFRDAEERALYYEKMVLWLWMDCPLCGRLLRSRVEFCKVSCFDCLKEFERRLIPGD